MTAIEVRNAVKSYEKEVVLVNFNMTVMQGSIYALMGSSGCGKTTLLQCFVGIKQLDSGSIKIMNKRVGKHCSDIGFMPQNAALIDEFTIRELMSFFGTIYGLKSTQIKDRVKSLLELLELRHPDAIVGTCSGGERRRISLAVCMIHKPKLLILDEPTVGLDPLLREKIWKFLTSTAKDEQTTVVITTHYIEEAKQAGFVGLLRYGSLIAEDSPANLLTRCYTDSLEIAFLQLCEQQGDEKPTKTPEVSRKKLTINSTTKASFNPSKIKALTTKNFTQLLRRPAVLGFMLLTPFLCLVSFYLTIGSDPIGLRIGIVNLEVDDPSECLDPLLKVTTIVNFNCKVSKISCRFVNSINDSVAEKKFYKSFDEAYEDVKRGKLIGLIHIPINFTSTMTPLNDVEDFTGNQSNSGEIQIFLDQSDRQITFFLQQRLFDIYEFFMENLMRDCGKSKKIGSTPIQINAMFGTMQDEMQRTMTPGIIISLYFYLASTLSSGAFIADRLDGIWNRVVLAGADPGEIFLSHVISNSAIMILQSLEFLLLTKYIYKLENLGTDWIVMLMIVMVGLSAIIYGLAVSSQTDNYMTATFGSSLIFYPMMIMCGIFWPLEAIPWYFRYIAYCLPFTLPTVALRNILYKGFSFMHSSVQIGFGVTSLWIILPLLFCYIGLRAKKFC